MKNPLSRFKGTFRALSYRNYRLFFFGQGLSLIGTWMQMIALAWLVYRITNSAFLLGLTGFLGQIFIFPFAPFAGVVADRFDRHKIMVTTQTLSMIQAFILAALVFTNTVSIWHIILLNIILGIINAFDMPARQSFVVEMVEKKSDLGNAIALNSSLFNVARLAGPSIAGLVIAAFGEGFCFLLNGISFLAVIFSLLAMRDIPKRKMKGAHPLRDLKEGIGYAYRFAPIRYLLTMMALISVIGMPYVVLMPVFARDILHGGPETLGLLMGASGIGAVSGALYLASRKSVRGLVNWIAVASFTFGVGLIAFSFSRTLWLSSLVLVVAGFGMIVQMAAGNTILQTIVDEDKRGRVMSLFIMAFIGTMPFGSLLSGVLADNIGVPYTVLLSGAVCVIAAALFTFKIPQLKKMIRPIYMKMGIIPEVTVAIGKVTELTVVTEKE
jgi:MFS family permease